MKSRYRRPKTVSEKVRTEKKKDKKEFCIKFLVIQFLAL